MDEIDIIQLRVKEVLNKYGQFITTSEYFNLGHCDSLVKINRDYFEKQMIYIDKIENKYKNNKG